MPWVSQKHLDELEQDITDATAALDEAASALKAKEQDTRRIANVEHLLATLPARIIDALRANATATLSLPIEQPPSLGMADKRRVQEAREREKETR